MRQNFGAGHAWIYEVLCDESTTLTVLSSLGSEWYIMINRQVTPSKGKVLLVSSSHKLITQAPSPFLV